MVDFEPGEKLYAANLDPDSKDKVIRCFYQGQTMDGEIVIALVSGEIRRVPLTSIRKEPRMTAQGN